jgi:hypothetical protein
MFFCIFSPAFFFAVLFFSRNHVTTHRGCIAKDDSCHVLGLMCLCENDGDHVLGSGCLIKSNDDCVLLSWVPNPSHRVSLGLMTVSERPPAKYLVGPLVVRFLAYFLILDPKTVSRGIRPMRCLENSQKIILYFRDVVFLLLFIFLLESQKHK